MERNRWLKNIDLRLFVGNIVGMVITIVLLIWLVWVLVTALGLSSYGAQAQ